MPVKLGVSDQNRHTPYDMPAIQVKENYLTMYANSAGTSYEHSQQQGFWDHINYNGAYANSAVAADTWVTEVDITGCGHLGAVVSWCRASGTPTHTFKITVDGVVYEREIQMAAGGHSSYTERIWLGSGLLVNIMINAGITGSHMTPYQTNMWYSHESTSKDDLYTASGYTNLTVQPPHVLLQEGIPTVPFRESLKVEQKSDAASNSSSLYYAHGCTYMITG